jgi:excisionase family DNA binding protein
MLETARNGSAAGVKTMVRERRYLTIGALARRLHVSWHWVWRRIQSGEIDAVQLADRSQYRIPRTAVEPLLQKMQKLHKN